MGNRHDDTAINSDQEDLVGSSSSELDDADEDDDISDVDGGGVQFNLCTKSNGATLSLIDSANDWNSTSTQDYQNAQQKHQQQIQHYRKCKRTFFMLLMFGFGLLFASFSLFIILPLYQKQLEIGRKTNNAYGSILFISPIITIILIILSNLLSYLFKWSLQVYKFPMPIRRLLVISLCCGIAGTLCTVSSYQRVPCHLQDPLKGAALVYSLVFYFFFCKKVMGLQKIFSATTAVVGLFISVDYGLCDEFRCHGNDITNSNTKEQNVGWQGRAFWTLLYVIGITLWTLHLSLLEGNLIMLSSTSSTPPANNLLTTISRLVSNSDRSMEEQQPLDRSSHPPKQRPKPIHLATWIHLISLLVILTFGLIDIIPKSGSTNSFSQHWYDTGNTFICHFGISPTQKTLKIKTMNPNSINLNNNLNNLNNDDNRILNKTNDTLDYLSNLTPDSILYNETVQELHRDKRNLENRHMKYFHRRIGHHITDQTDHIQIYSRNHSVILNKTMIEMYYNHHALKKYNKNLTMSSTKPLISRLVNNNNNNNNIGNNRNDENGDELMGCKNLRSYSWLFILIYIVFILCIFHFLDISESAVFTIAIISGALPFVGLFWSTFKLNSTNGIASIIWAPSISGELICSLLGTPIVFLGLILLYRAHFSDLLRPITTKTRTTSSTASTNVYTSLRDA